ncbi:hypothetical protein A6J66_004775 [Yersinia enterocolitica]|nr:hypothetical protein A6J66_004775 [Yersinia enterocolitica]
MLKNSISLDITKTPTATKVLKQCSFGVVRLLFIQYIILILNDLLPHLSSADTHHFLIILN